MNYYAFFYVYLTYSFKCISTNYFKYSMVTSWTFVQFFKVVDNLVFI